MGESNPSEKKELFIGSQLRPQVGHEENPDIPQVSPSATNQEIQNAAIKVLGGSSSVSGPGPEAWQKLKECRFQAHDDVHSSVLEGETVLLNLDNGMYYSLNKVGTVIWELCDGQHTLEKVLQKICDRFDVEEEQAKQDLLVLSSQLLNQKLLITVP